MWVASVAESGTLRLPFGTGRTSPVAAADVARVVATVLEDPRPHLGHVYELTGPRCQDMTGVAEEFSRALGRPITFVDIPFETWVDGIAYRLRAKAEHKPKFGLQLDILEIRPAVPEDAADGYDFFDLVESSEFPVKALWGKVQFFVEKYITDPRLNRLVRQILQDHEDLFSKMPAAVSVFSSSCISE